MNENELYLSDYSNQYERTEGETTKYSFITVLIYTE